MKSPATPQEQAALDLREFYLAIHEWYIQGMPFSDRPAFLRVLGLCHSLIRWMEYTERAHWRSPRMHAACDAMKAQFKDAGLNERYPFNNGDCRSYSDESEDGAKWQNAERINWIKEHAA